LKSNITAENSTGRKDDISRSQSSVARLSIQSVGDKYHIDVSNAKNREKCCNAGMEHTSTARDNPLEEQEKDGDIVKCLGCLSASSQGNPAGDGLNTVDFQGKLLGNLHLSKTNEKSETQLVEESTAHQNSNAELILSDESSFGTSFEGSISSENNGNVITVRSEIDKVSENAKTVTSCNHWISMLQSVFFTEGSIKLKATDESGPQNMTNEVSSFFESENEEFRESTFSVSSRSAPDGRKIECVDSIAKSENDESHSGIAENINCIAESIRSEELSGSTSDLCLNLRESMKSKDANCVQDMENCACSESNNSVQTLEKDNVMHLDTVSNNETLKYKIICDENHVVHDNITNSTESMTKERVGNFPSNSGLETRQVRFQALMKIMT